MTPAFKIMADGIDVTGGINDRLVKLTVTDNDGTKSDTVSIVLDDRDFALAKPRKGAMLAVFMGYRETGLALMGLFKVNRVQRSFKKDSGRVMEVTGKSADLKEEMKSQRTGQYDDKTLEQIVGEVAGRHGLGSTVSPKIGKVTYKHEPQTEESDLHLLTRLAHTHDAFMKVAGGKVLMIGRDEVMSGVVTLPMSWFDECSVEEDDRASHKEANAHWRDRSKGERVKETQSGGEGGRFTLRHTFATKDLAKAAAEGKKKELARKEATLTGKGVGRTDLMAGTRIVTVIGADPYDGLWMISTATHEMTKKGYSTSISTDKGQGGGEGGGGG